MGFDEARPVVDRHADDHDDDVLRCVACGHAITRRREACARGGAPVHTFVNPYGVVFEVACYARAPGAVGVGDFEDTFSWFPGYAWQRAACGGCGAHVGWRFRCGGDEFCGVVTTAIGT